MSVFRELSFTFKGETVTFTPDLALLTRIEDMGINTTRMATACINGGVQIPKLAIAMSAVMGTAGKPTSAEDCYAFLAGGGEVVEIQSFQRAFTQAVLPSVDFGKKPEAPAKKTTSKKRASKSST